MDSFADLTNEIDRISKDEQAKHGTMHSGLEQVADKWVWNADKGDHWLSIGPIDKNGLLSRPLWDSVQSSVHCPKEEILEVYLELVQASIISELDPTYELYKWGEHAEEGQRD